MHAAGEWGQRKKKLLENAGPLEGLTMFTGGNSSAAGYCYVMNYNW